MKSKVYLNDGSKVFMKDSVASRQLKSFYKESTVIFDDENLYLEREGNKVLPDFSEEGIDRDEIGFFIYLGDI